MVAVVATGAVYGLKAPARLWVIATVASAMPDLDYGLHAYGVDYADLWGHRGMMHSVFFAVMVAAGTVLLFFRPRGEGVRRSQPGQPRARFPADFRSAVGVFLFLSALIASHGFIDAFTNGGLGIAFFSPFSAERHFMPWTPIEVPDLGLRSIFRARFLEVMMSEILWVWLPVLAIGAIVVAARRVMAPARSASSGR